MKKMNHFIKILTAIFAIMIITCGSLSFTNQSFASTTSANENVKMDSVRIAKLDNEPVVKVSATTMDDIFTAARDFIKLGKDNEGENTVEFFALEFSAIGTILFSIGMATLIIVSGIMAIKWITATPDKQAKLKQQLIGLVVATVVIVAAIGIWNFVRGIGRNVEERLEATETNQIVVADIQNLT